MCDEYPTPFTFIIKNIFSDKDEISKKRRHDEEKESQQPSPPFWYQDDEFSSLGGLFSGVAVIAQLEER